jgi:hypothetical protein
MKKLYTAAIVLGALGFLWSAKEYSNAQNGNNGNAYQNEVKMEERDGYRYITSNGIPDHQTGQFPGRGNPNRISPQRHYFRMTLTPKIAEKTTDESQGKIGVCLNGVPFDPGTAEWYNDDPDSGWHIVAHAGTNSLGLDWSNAHVQPNGSYHYHGLPYGWLSKLPDPAKPQIVLTGYAADGFPIYSLYGYTNPNDAKSTLKELRSSYQLKKGTRPDGPGGAYDGTYDQDYEYVQGSGDLDECDGRTGVTPEYPNGTYYYVLTEEYPYMPRKFRGTPDRTFIGPRGRPPMGGQGGRGPGGQGGRGGEGGQGGPPDGPDGAPPFDGPPPF